MHMQMATLDSACKVHPQGRWWIKADGCDIVSGLEESLRLEWNGDADYGTEVVEELYRDFQARLSAVDSLCSDQPIVGRSQVLSESVKDEFDKLCDDVNFIGEGTCTYMHR